MSTKASIASVALFVDQEVTLNGWLYNIRGSGKIAFPNFAMERESFKLWPKKPCSATKPSMNCVIWDKKAPEA